MNFQPDFQTVLFLYTTSQVVGAACLCYMWTLEKERFDILEIAAGLLLTALGTILRAVSLGSIGEMVDASLFFGLVGPALFVLGTISLSQPTPIGIKFSPLFLYASATLIFSLVIARYEFLHIGSYLLINALDYAAATFGILVGFRREAITTKKIISLISFLLFTSYISSFFGQVFLSGREALLMTTFLGFSQIVLLLCYTTFTAVMLSERQILEKVRLANTDALTNLRNRRSFWETLSNVRIEHGAILLFDIDHFKSVNDQYGHLVGDVVLKRVATEIDHNLRSSDICARYGGEEFVVFLNNAGPRTSREIAEAIRDSIEKMRLGEGMPSITISGGLYYPEEKTLSLEQIVKRADDLLYQAKHAGRNRVYFAPESVFSSAACT